jgi:hypothetical protein
MSTSISQQAQQASGIVPFDLKGAKPSAEFLPPPGAAEESLADGIGSSYGVLHYKGKNWSLRIRAESYMFVRPDDGTPISYIDAIIIRQAPVKAKSYYEGTYVEGQSEGKRPACSSIDGVRPDADAAQPQSNACAICPKNEWKMMENGKKGRDCTDYKRLAVLLLPAQTQRLLGEPLLEPVFLRIPPASLNDLALYGENMKAQGWPYYALVTRISFDTVSAHPKFQFRALQGLTGKEAPLIMKLREDTLARRITGEDQIAAAAGAPLAAIAGSQQTQPQITAQVSPLAVPAATQVVQQPVTQGVQQPVQPVVQQTVQEVIPPQPSTQVAAPRQDAVIEQPMVDLSGFGAPGVSPPQVTQPVVQAAAAQPVVQAAAPTLAVEEAPSDLDDQIAKLLEVA